MKNYKIYTLAFLLASSLFTSCEDDENFDNKVYFNVASKTSSILFKSSISSAQRTLQVSLAKQESKSVEVTFKVAPELVGTYNKAYYDKAIILPADSYELAETKVVINAGSVASKQVPINFKGLDKLDRETVYVLPVTIATANIAVLESARTTYFVFKGAALINVVADIESNNLHIDTWAKPDVVNNLTQLTMEALIRVRNYDRLISTVMGIEGQFLIRLGDAGFPSNQIQIATSAGNFPAADANKGLPTNEWVHIALTYDSVTGDMKIYVNGKVQSEGVKKAGPVNLGKNGVDGFYIGRSYEDSRFLAGEISECRIWNVVRTQEQIAGNPYDVDPASAGLVAYWKCNEGGGSVVKDYTGNGNDLTAKSAIKWTPVALPAISK